MVHGGSRALVVGRGIVGLTTARSLRARGMEVVLMGVEPGVTSQVAGGYWMPFKCEPAAAVARWATATLKWYREQETTNRSIESLPAFVLFEEEESRPEPEWGWAADLKRVSGRENLERAMADSEGIEAPEGYNSAWAFQTVVVNSPVFMAELEAEFSEVVSRKCENLRQSAVEFGCDIVVNCAGLDGAKLALDDPSLMTPGRGAIAQYPRPRNRLKAVVTAEAGPLVPEASKPAYCIPRGDVVVVGGSYDEGDYSVEPTELELERIAKNAAAYAPADLAGVEPLKKIAGRRPVRKLGVRCEVQAPVDGLTIAHNYGHGGSGWTTCFGCAEDIADALSGFRLKPSS